MCTWRDLVVVKNTPEHYNFIVGLDRIQAKGERVFTVVLRSNPIFFNEREGSIIDFEVPSFYLSFRLTLLGTLSQRKPTPMAKPQTTNGLTNPLMPETKRQPPPTEVECAD